MYDKSHKQPNLKFLSTWGRSSAEMATTISFGAREAARSPQKTGMLVPLPNDKPRRPQCAYSNLYPPLNSFRTEKNHVSLICSTVSAAVPAHLVGLTISSFCPPSTYFHPSPLSCYPKKPCCQLAVILSSLTSYNASSWC